MTLNCEFTKDVAELYYEDMLSPETRQAVKAHLRTCPNCQRHYQQYENFRHCPLPIRNFFPNEKEESDIEKRLYQKISRKLRRRRFWNIAGTSAAIGAGGVMFIIGIFLSNHKNSL